MDGGKQGLLQEIEALEEGIKMAETVVKGFTQSELDFMRETSRILQEMDWNEYLYEAEQKGIAIGEEKGIAIGEQKGIAIGEQKGLAIGEQKGIAIGQKELIGLLESGKSLEEAKRILGIE
jgi:flagellar biosynthesis/type III secretory pathway protein FliH